jgi:hypothetical protein
MREAQTRNLEIPGSLASLTPRNDSRDHFQSTILLVSPSNSIPQNVPP